MRTVRRVTARAYLGISIPTRFLRSARHHDCAIKTVELHPRDSQFDPATNKLAATVETKTGATGRVVD